jgi:hypothetical protein
MVKRKKEKPPHDMKRTGTRITSKAEDFIGIKLYG